jgi:hypothetical protein
MIEWRLPCSNQQCAVDIAEPSLSLLYLSGCSELHKMLQQRCILRIYRLMSHYRIGYAVIGGDFVPN